MLCSVMVASRRPSLESTRKSVIEITATGMEAAVITRLKTTGDATSFDFLINNAGMGATVPFEQVSEELFDEFLNVHYKGVFS